MRKAPKVQLRHLAPGAALAEQGEPEDYVFLLLDGTLIAEIDGRALGKIEPGSILGARALGEHRTRTTTLRAKTRCLVVVVIADELRRYALAVDPATYPLPPSC